MRSPRVLDDVWSPGTTVDVDESDVGKAEKPADELSAVICAALNRLLQERAGLTLTDPLLFCEAADAPGNGLGTAELAESVNVGKSAITKTTDRLEERVLLVRERPALRAPGSLRVAGHRVPWTRAPKPAETAAATRPTSSSATDRSGSRSGL